MKDRRRPDFEITPSYEDTGLFKTPVRQIVAELVPQMSRNSRRDLLVRGYIDGNYGIDVVFAGRRTKSIGKLERQLKALMHVRHADPLKDDVLPRIPIRLEGAWRSRFHRDRSGWETRSHQFMAARWTLLSAGGRGRAFGEPPV